jgi:hypothetical protein
MNVPALSRFFPVTVSLTLLLAASAAQAQDAIGHAPAPIPESAIDDGSIRPRGGVPGGPGPFRVGPFVGRPHVAYSYTYSDGVRVQPGVTASTSRHRIAAGVLLELGPRWAADYTAAWNRFSYGGFDNSWDHSLSLRGSASYYLWNFGLRHNTTFSNSPIIETARQTEEENHTTSITASRPITSRLFGDIGVTQSLRYVEASPNIYTWTVAPGATYMIGPGLTTSLNMVFGHTVVTESPDMTFYRPQLGLNWQVSPRLSTSAFVGREWRKFETGNIGTMEAPVYGGSIVYHPLPTTSVSLSGSRQVTASYFRAQISERTSWSLDLNQRLLQRFFLSAGYGWGDSTYRITAPGLSVGREDDYRTYHARLSTTFMRNGSIGVGWRRQKNTSSTNLFAFDSDQWMVDIRYAF